MSINQSDNRKNEFYINENTHNTMSISFFLILFLLSFALLLISALESMIIISVFSLTVVISCFIKLIFQIRSYILLSKLCKSVEEASIPFYITKSWFRKKQGTIWTEIIFITTNIIFIIATLISINSIGDMELIVSLIILISTFFISIIIAYLNSQILDGYLKFAERKMNLHTTEWIQIKRDQRISYRLIYVWYLSILTIIPLFLMVIPSYRQAIYNIVKK